MPGTTVSVRSESGVATTSPAGVIDVTVAAFPQYQRGLRKAPYASRDGGRTWSLERSGAVSGSLRVFGGVADAPRAGSPVAGDVVFTSSQGVHTTIMVGKSGDFDLRLPAGTYTALGGPPGWHNHCYGNRAKPIRVLADERANVVVACDAE
jgi:hypothetical protein